MSEQLYKDIIDSLPYAFLVLDEELRIIQYNQSCEILLSRTKGEILGSRLPEVIPHRGLGARPEQFYKKVEQNWSNSISTSNPLES